MNRSRSRLFGLGLAALATLPLAGCASLGSNAAPAVTDVVGLRVRNGLEVQLAIWIDGRILDFVGPFQTVCIDIPIPFQNGILTVTDNQLPVRSEITRTPRTRFETQSGWSLEISIPVRTPTPVTPSPACA